MKEKQKTPISIIKWVLIIIGALIVIGVIGNMLGGDDSDMDVDPATSQGSEPSETQPTAPTSESEEPSSEPTDNILLDDDFIKVTYEGVFEYESVDAFYLTLLVENKCDQTIRVYLTDASVNTSEVMPLGGIATEIRPGYNAKGAYCFTYIQTTIASLEELETVSFKVWVKNDSFEDLETSEEITIPFG